MIINKQNDHFIWQISELKAQMFENDKEARSKTLTIQRSHSAQNEILQVSGIN